jgi:hemerythrin superfamily protein
MKKVIRLDENDIEKLVKKIIKEGDSDKSQLHQEGYNIGQNMFESLSQLLSQNKGREDVILQGFEDRAHKHDVLMLGLDVNYQPSSRRFWVK